MPLLGSDLPGIRNLQTPRRTVMPGLLGIALLWPAILTSVPYEVQLREALTRGKRGVQANHDCKIYFRPSFRCQQDGLGGKGVLRYLCIITAGGTDFEVYVVEAPGITPDGFRIAAVLRPA